MTNYIKNTVSRVKASLKYRSHRFLYRYVIWPAPAWIIKGIASFDIGDHQVKLNGPRREDLQMMRLGSYEAGLGKIMSELVRPGDVFFDIGAHIGIYSIVASATVGDEGHVYAFEPDPVALTYLKQNVEENDAQNLTIVETAVSDSDGEAKITAGKFGYSGTTLGTRTGADQIETVAHTVRLDTFCETHNVSPDVVKVDIEGGEVKLLKSGIEILRQSRVVFFEFHPVKIRSDFGEEPDAIYSEIRQLGKRLQVVDGASGKPLLRNVEPDERFIETTRLILTQD